MQVRHGPATVTGDELYMCHYLLVLFKLPLLIGFEKEYERHKKFKAAQTPSSGA